MSSLARKQEIVWAGVSDCRDESLRFTTMRASTLAHSDETKQSGVAFQVLSTDDQDAVIECLKTPQVLPPGTKDRIVDENFHARTWPPQTFTPGPIMEHKK